MKIAASRVAVLAGYAALGPITGPLVAGMVRSLRKGEAPLAALYALAIPVSYVGLTAAAAVMLPAAARAAGV